jgi:hypothetical protein
MFSQVFTAEAVEAGENEDVNRNKVAVWAPKLARREGRLGMAWAGVDALAPTAAAHASWVTTIDLSHNLIRFFIGNEFSSLSFPESFLAHFQ